jgi:hypothetical protein
VVLPALQAELTVDRVTASVPYTLIGFALGGVLMGRMADRFAASYATNLWQFALAHGLLIAQLGGAATFHRLSPICRTGSPGGATLRLRSRHRATIWLAPFGPLRAAFHPDHCLAATSVCYAPSQ